eukprot:SAG31_NODE_43783_length_270_cov_1.180723_1_plen_33_part_10
MADSDDSSSADEYAPCVSSIAELGQEPAAEEPA